jgi:hypothetical protein
MASTSAPAVSAIQGRAPGVSGVVRQAREGELQGGNRQAMLKLIARLHGAVERIAKLCFGPGPTGLPPVPAGKCGQCNEYDRNPDQPASDPQVLGHLPRAGSPACLHQAFDAIPSTPVALAPHLRRERSEPGVAIDGRGRRQRFLLIVRKLVCLHP